MCSVYPEFIVKNIQVGWHQVVQKIRVCGKCSLPFFLILPSQKSVTSDNASEASNPPNVSKIFVSYEFHRRQYCSEFDPILPPSPSPTADLLNRNAWTVSFKGIEKLIVITFYFSLKKFRHFFLAILQQISWPFRDFN